VHDQARDGVASVDPTTRISEAATSSANVGTEAGASACAMLESPAQAVRHVASRMAAALSGPSPHVDRIVFDASRSAPLCDRIDFEREQNAPRADRSAPNSVATRIPTDQPRSSAHAKPIPC
jgi:hypothetical protein